MLCHSAARVAPGSPGDRAIREKQEARLVEDLERLGRRIAQGKLAAPLAIGKAIGRLQERYPRVARYWRIDYRPETKSFTAEPNFLITKVTIRVFQWLSHFFSHYVRGRSRCVSGP